MDQIIRIAQDPALKSDARAKDRRAAIREVAKTVFDFPETARRALGQHWLRLSEKDRAEFVPLFTDLLERSYVIKIEQYSGEKISYVGESVDTGGELATVKTAFTTQKGAEVPINYHVVRVVLGAAHAPGRGPCARHSSPSCTSRCRSASSVSGTSTLPFRPTSSGEALPWEAAFLAAKCFLKYRRAGGRKRSPLPDFYVGAHAAVRGLPLLTRDARRYRSYFPRLTLVVP
ncbi:MAG: ABC transporter substrate-binding protein [Candidatus Rokubacteria bacterium]|nr:ABC transporter substrate-binding protein [Candidatus Rokubacteria bacterium]